MRNEQQAQVLSGLAAGEQLLIGPDDAAPLRQKPVVLTPGSTANSAIAAKTGKQTGTAQAAGSAAPVASAAGGIGPTSTMR